MILCLATISIFGVSNIRIEKVKIVIKEYKELTEKKLIKSNNDLAVQEKLNNYNFQIPKKELENNKLNLKEDSADSLIEQVAEEVAKDFNDIDESKISKTSSKDVINFILINRWIGIDSLILVSSSKNKGYDLFFRALKEDKDFIDYTFYEKEFGLVDVKTNVDTGKTVMKGNTLPGIISFLYYTGSPLFLLLSIILIFIVFNSLENFLSYITGKNLIFICFISNMIATRLFHFGYAPKDSYMFLTSIVLAILFLIMLMRFRFRSPR